MKATTGLVKEEAVDLCAMIHTSIPAREHVWPSILGLFKSVQVTLTYLRRNRVQVDLAETLGVSQPTVGRAIGVITPSVERALRAQVPTADDLQPGTQYLVDGSLLPCWSWADHRELWSGRHKTAGYNVHVAATLDGALAWISDPADGSVHDVTALDDSEALRICDPADWIGDKGYIGRDMLTPIKKPAHRDLLDWEKEFNTAVNRIRATIERVIAHFKNWRTMHTDYRRPLTTFQETISTVIALHFWATA